MSLEERVAKLEDRQNRLIDILGSAQVLRDNGNGELPVKTTKVQLAKQKREGQILTGQELLSNFPKQLQGKLNVSDMDEQWYITKAYDRTEQGKSDWTLINNLVKNLGGVWVADGKNSRWEVPK